MSSERGEWEEIPLELVDLARTKKEAAQHEEDLKADAKAQAAEDAAERLAVREVEEIPPEPGVYYIHDNKLEAVKVAESKVVTDKRRQSPESSLARPDGLRQSDAGNRRRYLFQGNRPTNAPSSFSASQTSNASRIVKLAPTKKGSRIVENIHMIPVTKEIQQEFKEIETFKKQEGDNVYKIWPEKDLDPGEYALVEYTEGLESINTQVWDFKIK